MESIRKNNAGISLPQKRAVVVGGTSGIGEGIALRLARANVSVSVVGRSRERGEEVVRRMRELSSSESGAEHEFVACDSFLMRNIVSTCAALRERHGDRIDWLVLSQGMATVQGRTETAEGIDEKLALHFFGRMLFVRELLPALRRAAASEEEKERERNREREGESQQCTADNNNNNNSNNSTCTSIRSGWHSGKVLSVLSAGVHSAFSQTRADFELRESYSIKNAADAAGFYNDLALHALSRQPENAQLTFIHAAPGFVATRWGTEMPWYIRGAVRALQVFGRSAEDCGEAMSDSLFTHRESGLALVDKDGNPARLTSAHEEALSDWVWQRTNQVLDRALQTK